MGPERQHDRVVRPYGHARTDACPDTRAHCCANAGSDRGTHARAHRGTGSDGGPSGFGGQFDRAGKQHSHPLRPPGSDGTLLPSGYLSTSGSEIVDAAGAAVTLNAINWYGMETTELAPQGLDTVSYITTMQQMVAEGFNAIRIPFSLQSLATDSMPTDINYSINPQLAGLNSMGVLDAIVTEAGKLGLKIILDDANSVAGSGPNPDGLWYDSGYTRPSSPRIG